MPNLADAIEGFVVGDDLQVRRTIGNIPATQTVIKAWFTIKSQVSDLDPGIMQKVITQSDNPGTGRIEDAGASGTAIVRFDLTPADTLLLTPKTKYWFDIQLRTSLPGTYTSNFGYIRSSAQVTDAVS